MTLVMGVVNVTADSFSDGGHYFDEAAAVRHGLRLASEGAAIIDVGGESTRPGAARVPQEEELARVVPVVSALAKAGLTVSVDTMRAATATAAVAAGATIVNDVSGGKADPQMFAAVAATRADYVLMHWRAHSLTMQEQTHYGDVVADVVAEILIRRDRALAAGIPPERIILDPGIGFSKTWEQNWDLLANLEPVLGLGHRVLVGASRKRFLGELLDGRAPAGRDAATAALSAWCALTGVWGVRTHEVRAQVDAVRVAERLRSARRAVPGARGVESEGPRG